MATTSIRGPPGLRALPAQPVFYLSEEGHPSLDKAARLAGLGHAAVRRVPVDERLRLDAGALAGGDRQ